MIYTGLRFNEIAGEDLDAFLVTRFVGGQALHVDGSNANHQKQIAGITFRAVASGVRCYVRGLGVMVNADWTWTPGAALYPDTDGTLTATPPGASTPQVAFANTATEIFVQIRPRDAASDDANSHVHAVDQFTLNGTDITNKYVLLALDPILPLGVALEVAGAPALRSGTDFTMDGVNPKKLAWSSLLLDGLLASGDKLTVRYYRLPS